MAPGRNAPISAGPEPYPLPDVAVLRWPTEAGREASLARRGALRLLLVEEEVEPPIVDDASVDWIRLPADERDVAARLLGLVRRNAPPAEAPHVDDADRLLYRGQWVGLSPIEARLAASLGQQFGDIVTTSELMTRAWPPGPGAPMASESALRVHITRLRRRVAALGLEVRSVRKQGLIMQPATAPPGAGDAAPTKSKKARRRAS
jgi:DNA-binding winged helix-turn-helix (wHTH) protein